MKCSIPLQVTRFVFYLGISVVGYSNVLENSPKRY